MITAQDMKKSLVWLKDWALVIGGINVNSVEQVQREYKEVTDWVLNEEDKVVEKLKAEGKYIGGLDGNSADFAYIYKERNRRIAEIKKRYNLV